MAATLRIGHLYVKAGKATRRRSPLARRLFAAARGRILPPCVALASLRSVELAPCVDGERPDPGDGHLSSRPTVWLPQGSISVKVSAIKAARR